VSSATILVIEDDPNIRRGLVDTLAAGGYRTIEAADGHTGLKTALSADYALMLLDIRLPGPDGFQILEELRKSRPATPVIMATAVGDEKDRVRGLRGGADDYIIKGNFSALELLARVEAVLRRSAERAEVTGAIDLGGRTVDLEQRRIEFADGRRTDISQKEAELLQYLASSRARPVSRDELLQHVWGLDPRGIETRTIDMHVARLREKLESAEIIRTVRGKGYQLA
jgi:DNA-binding response OmpR family regulator